MNERKIVLWSSSQDCVPAETLHGVMERSFEIASRGLNGSLVGPKGMVDVWIPSPIAGPYESAEKWALGKGVAVYKYMATSDFLARIDAHVGPDGVLVLLFRTADEQKRHLARLRERWSGDPNLVCVYPDGGEGDQPSA